MTFRAKALVWTVSVGAIASVASSTRYPALQWMHFFVYFAAILLSSGMKVALPKREGTMSVNFPFILLGILQLSPLQAVILATSSVFAQCRFRVTKTFTAVQILFNVANVATATVLAWQTYAGLVRLFHAELAPALAIAATVYFLANTLPVAVIIAWESGASPLKLWRQEFLWYVPFYFAGAVLAAAGNLIGNLFGWLTSLLLIPIVYIVYRAYCAQMAIVRDREQHIVEIEALHLRTIEGLAMAVEAKDSNTHHHLMRVRVYVSELGKIMGLDHPTMQALLTAAYLHDIGKLAVPEYIINKPGKLTPEEFDKMKIHPVVGADILTRVNFPYPVVPMVRSHHESWDGAGYPDGLKGEEIPIGARILTAVDCFDALASDRPYRKALPVDEAMAFVKSRAGIQFDASVVALLAEHYPRLEDLARKQIEEVQPLKTDLFIERGAAPGAGFATEQRHASPAQKSDTKRFDSGLPATEEVRTIFRLGQLLADVFSGRAAGPAMAELLQSLIPLDCFAVYLKDGESVSARHLDGRFARAFTTQPIPIGEGVSGWVALNGRAIVNGNPTVEPNWLAGSGLFTGESSALSVPLFGPDGGIAGAIAVYCSAPAAFSKDHQRILEEIQSMFSHSAENETRAVLSGASAR